jgi:hypothetical protein
MSEVSEEGGVGYGKPPKRSRFQKGRSGNPKGRPKGSGIRSSVEKVLERTITMTIDGVRRRVPITEAMVTQMAQRALAGDPGATRDFLKIAGQAAAARAEDDAKPVGQTVIIKRFGPPKGCDGALELLGVVVDVDDQLKIQPWVVEAARARGLKLSETDEALVEKFTVVAGDEVRERMRGESS